MGEAASSQSKLPKTMRAAVLVGPRHVEVQDVPLKPPAAGQVLVKLQGCGLCSSNLPIWQGRPWFDYPQPPGAPGHEGWGNVVAVGEGVQNVQLGSRVAALSYNAYAEFDVVPQEQLVELLPQVRDQDVPGEPLGCAMNIFRRGDIRSGQTLVIIGIGFLGALLTDLATRHGARVIAVSRRAFARQIAAKMGASVTLPFSQEVTNREVMRLTDGRGAERVIEAVGSQLALDIASPLVAERGRLVLAGFHQDGKRGVDMQSWNWRGIDVVNAHEREPSVYVSGIRAAVDALIGGRLNPGMLYTHRFRLDDIATGFASLEERPEGFLKGMVVP